MAPKNLSARETGLCITTRYKYDTVGMMMMTLIQSRAKAAAVGLALFEVRPPEGREWGTS